EVRFFRARTCHGVPFRPTPSEYCCRFVSRDTALCRPGPKLRSTNGAREQGMRSMVGGEFFGGCHPPERTDLAVWWFGRHSEGVVGAPYGGGPDLEVTGANSEVSVHPGTRNITSVIRCEGQRPDPRRPHALLLHSRPREPLVPAPPTTVRELRFRRSGVLEWGERRAPELQEPTDAIVRPFVAGRCDGDTLPIHRPVSRAMQAGMALGVIDPVVGSICGRVPFRGPFAIGHECVAEVLQVGSGVRGLKPGDRVVVPWSVSCGTCDRCRRGLTSKCTTTARSTLAAYGFGPASGDWGGMVTDTFRVPFADHMLVPVPDQVSSLRVAAASDNLSDAWRTVSGPLTACPGGTVLVLGGGAKSIGLYAAGIAVALGASEVDYFDDDPERRGIAESFGARVLPLEGARPRRGGYDVTVEATSNTRGLQRAVRALAPGGVCTAVGYYV